MRCFWEIITCVLVLQIRTIRFLQTSVRLDSLNCFKVLLKPGWRVKKKKKTAFAWPVCPLVSKNREIPSCLSGTQCYPASFSCITTWPWVACVAFLSAACTNMMLFSRNRSSRLIFTHQMSSFIQTQTHCSFQSMWCRVASLFRRRAYMTGLMTKLAIKSCVCVLRMYKGHYLRM